MFADLILGAVITLLPPRMRENWFPDSSPTTAHAAIISGSVQWLAGIALLIGRYYYFMTARLGEYAGAIIAKGHEEALGDKAIQYGMGFFTLMEFLIHPITLLAIYICTEGLVRAAAGLITGETVGTLPLYAIDWSIKAVNARRAEAELGPLVRDEVRRFSEEERAIVDYELAILSCRPKDWHALKTISFEEELWELVRTESGDPPRRFVYLLRRAPVSKVVRGLEEYDPEAVLGLE